MKIFTKAEYSPDELALIEHEHLKAYLRLFRGTVFVQTLFPLVLTYVFYSLLPSDYLFGWLAAILVLTGMRGYLTFVWFKLDAGEAKTQLFERYSLGLSLIAGCLWGMTVLVMDFNQYPEESVFLNIIVFGLTAGSTGIGSYWVAYFLIFNLSVFSIYIGAYLIGIPSPYYLLAISLALFLLFMLQIVLVFHRSNAQNIWLAIRNEKLAKNLESKKDQAEEFAASRTRFLASASHDLRQPLQALNFFLSALQPNLSNDKSREIYTQLENCTDGINDLLNSILDISKLDAETFTLKNQPCSLHDMLSSLEKQLLNQAEEKGIALKFEHTQEYVTSDFVLLQRILSNLISNAVNYTEHGEVAISLQRKDSALTIHVTDTGIGIDEHEQTRIFEEFYQLNNPERDRKKGLGLGLSIVSKLCQLMNIPLELTSEKGKGSRFSITLPACDAPKITEQPKKAATYNHLDSQHILVIDDELSIRESLNELLSQWQCVVQSAESEDVAVEIIKQKSFVPDLIISDYRLRDNKTGVEAVDSIKALLNKKDLPAIIISGDTEPARLKEVALSGYELLHKPVKPAQLRMLMQRKLN